MMASPNLVDDSFSRSSTLSSKSTAGHQNNDFNDTSFDDPETLHEFQQHDARPVLPKASFFLGDLRDGLPMLNMQAVFLISDMDYTEKQIGLLFLVFGISQFLFMAPVGYVLDYSRQKIEWVCIASLGCAALTVLTTVTAEPEASNLPLMLVIKFLQGACTAVLPPGFNAITMGIVGSKGFTHQVSRNRMMNHVGTALVVAVGSLIAYMLFPNIGALFVVAPLSAAGVWYYLHLILPHHVHTDAARQLIYESPTMAEYELVDELLAAKQQAAVMEAVNHQNNTNKVAHARARYVGSSSSAQAIRSKLHPYEPPEASRKDPTPASPLERKSSRKSYSSLPSFRFGWSNPTNDSSTTPTDSGHKADTPHSKPRTPLNVLMNPHLMVFTVVIFFYHLSNSSVLPLVMQSLALRDPQAGILLSGLCIVLAQGLMSFFAKWCGDFSPIWGRKNLILIGLVSLTVRCFLLTLLLSAEETVETLRGQHVIKALILSTQFLDAVGAGILGTLQILVTSDLAGGSGRFSLLMGVTTSAMCLGATVSGYLGQALAQDYGYPFAFTSLGLLSLIPFCLYVFLMPETLPEMYQQSKGRRRGHLREVLNHLNDHRKRLLQSKASPLFHSKKQVVEVTFDSPSSLAGRNIELV